MRAKEFVIEYKQYPTREYEGVTFTMMEKDGQLIVKALNDFGLPMGHVVFGMDGKELDPKDLEVYDKYQRQGVARVMYDYIKSQGFTIIRSFDQTDAGKGFWDKHRGEDAYVWEDRGQGAAGIILYAQDTGRYGLQQRSDNINDGGQWAAWGGGREPGESLEQCALRELAEEGGYTGPIKLKRLAENSRYVTFIGVVPHEFKPRANDEWKDYCWVEAGDWPSPMHPGVAAALKNIPVNENMDHSKDGRAVEELKAALLARKDRLQSASDDQVYDIIDQIMTRIAKSHSISGQQLHDMWVDKYKEIPDTWIMNENFADGKNPGRKGLAKRVGVNCKQSVSKLRSIAAHSSGEKQRMAHWCANMKSGKNK